MTKNWMVVLALVFSLAITGTAMAQTDQTAPAADENKVENVSPTPPQSPRDFKRGHHGRGYNQQWSGGPMAKFMKDETVQKIQDELKDQEIAFQALLDEETIDEAKASELTQKISGLKADLAAKRLEHILAFKKANPDWKPMMGMMGMMDMMGPRGPRHGPGKGRPGSKGCMMMGMDRNPGERGGHHGMRGHMQRF